MGMELLMLSTMASIYGIHMWICAELCVPAAIVPTGPFRRPFGSSRISPVRIWGPSPVVELGYRLTSPYQPQHRGRFRIDSGKVDWKNEGF